MCRYTMVDPYTQKWACARCRKSWKSPRGEVPRASALCPQCRAPLSNMGLDFKAPRQTDKEQWRKVELLLQNGINYSLCGCGGPGFRPARLRDVPQFLQERAQNAANWQRQQRLNERAAELNARRKKQRERIEAKLIERLAR